MNLCPICDRKLVGSFCPSCRKLVRNPVVIPDGIRLNESHYGNDDMCEFHANDRHIPFLNRRHPEQEEDCSYHNENFHEKLPEKEKAPAGTGNVLLDPARPVRRALVIIIMIVMIYMIAGAVVTLFSVILPQIHI